MKKEEYVVISINTVVGEFEAYGPTTKAEADLLADTHPQYTVRKLRPMPAPWYGRDDDMRGVKIRVWQEGWMSDQFDVMTKGEAVAKHGKIRKLHDSDESNEDWDGESYYE